MIGNVPHTAGKGPYAAGRVLDVAQNSLHLAVKVASVAGTVLLVVE